MIKLFINAFLQHVYVIVNTFKGYEILSPVCEGPSLCFIDWCLSMWLSIMHNQIAIEYIYGLLCKNINLNMHVIKYHIYGFLHISLVTQFVVVIHFPMHKIFCISFVLERTSVSCVHVIMGSNMSKCEINILTCKSKRNIHY